MFGGWRFVQSVFVGTKPGVPLQGKIPSIRGLVSSPCPAAMRLLVPAAGPRAVLLRTIPRREKSVKIHSFRS